ncbi:MAG: hemerythrin family protein [Deltaproteobacteria bacterium]|nr:hemerythrin family protein [Deltaproteobacteria bacterium]
MVLFQWKNDYSVNVRQFDNHHKKLIDLINSLHDSMLTGKHQIVIGKILKDLLDYTRYHFGEEEKLMINHKFSGYAEHKSQHDKFVAKVCECIQRYESGALTMTIDLMNFLRDWLKSHILGTDKKYSEFFNSKNVA